MAIRSTELKSRGRNGIIIGIATDREAKARERNVLPCSVTPGNL